VLVKDASSGERRAKLAWLTRRHVAGRVQKVRDGGPEGGIVKVFVVDSHAIYRRGLVASLELLSFVSRVDQADGVRGAQSHAGLLDADVLIVDPSIAGGQAFIAAAGKRQRVIALASDCGEESVARVADAGVVGFLRKDTVTQDLLQAAMQAADGGAAIVTPELLGTLLRSRSLASGDPQHSAEPRLTERELQVLGLIAQGHPTREVAEELCYSERTVKNVLHDIVTKLNARSRSQAVAYAVRDGLI
jgi:DNA-binding NarL/FixJ family response regulator